MALRRYQKLLIGAFSVVFVLLLWQYLSTNRLVNPLVLPAPAAILDAFARQISSGAMLSDIGTSTARIMVGFTAAFLLAVPLGLLSGANDVIRNLMKPWVRLLQPIPGIAWVPFAFLLFGLSNSAAVFVITIAAFFPIFINVANAVQRFDKDLINVSRTLGANGFQTVAMVVLPGIVPDIITGSRIGMGFAWRAVVAAEMIGVQHGVGSLLIEAKNTAQTDIVIASMVTLGVLMLVFDRVIFEGLEKNVERWKGGAQEG